VQFAHVNGVTIHYQVIGAAGKPLIVFVNSIGTDFRIWRDVIVRLAGDYAILCYDMRGHGLSSTGSVPHSIEEHANDLAALMDHVRSGPALICGLSIGGMVAQMLWAQRPDLVSGLILCDTAHKVGTAEFWQARIKAVEEGGVEAIADAIMPRWFAPDFLNTVECRGYRTMLARQSSEGYAASCVALRDADLTDIAKRIDVPAIVVVGEHDGATPPSLCAEFARLIPNARFELIKNAGHIVPVEQPLMLSEIIRAFTALAREGQATDAPTRH